MKKETNRGIPLNISCLLAVAFGFSLMIFSSCKKLLSVDPPKTELTYDKVFSNDNSAVAAVSNIYTYFENYYLEGNLMPFVSLYVDEVHPTSADEESLMYYNNAITLDDYSNANTWKFCYFIIYECNGLLANLSNSSDVTPDTKKQITGEAQFLRAFAYYFLVNLYGDVPLVLSGDVKSTASLSRDSARDIYKQIILDLKDAKSNLSEVYPTTGRIRANKWCAVALLAKTDLYLGDWKDAEEQSSLVINSGEYDLDSLDKVFQKGSRETILQCWQKNGYTNIGRTYLPSSTNEAPLYAIDSSLLNAFEPGDRRKTDWLNSVMVSGITYYYPYKYKLRTTTMGSNGEYTILLRLGEQYLIRAGARARQNDLTGAISDLNAIRTRASLNELSKGLSQGDVLSAITQERRVELFTEWGQRFFYLKRTDQVNTVLGAIKPSWKSTAQLYPIPQNELNNDPHLTQNAGY
jgi:hypothetical protein